MPGLRERLSWDAEAGAVHDGPRRYLLMRPDVLMGAIVGLDPASQTAVLHALATSTARHGGDSLRAYAAQVNGDADALMAATVQAAADLGWGRWALRREGDALHLEVTHSPFAEGWRAAAEEAHPPRAVCAPIRGMLQALAGQLLDAPIVAEECSCAAAATAGSNACTFVARPGASSSRTGWTV